MPFQKLVRSNSDNEEVRRQAAKLKRDLVEDERSKRIFNEFMKGLKLNEAKDLQSTVKKAL